MWVDARVCFAKQLAFEKDIKMAIQILREICFLIPPMDIEGLSFGEQNYSKKTGY